MLEETIISKYTLNRSNFISFIWLIGLVVRVFTNGLEDQGSIHTKDFKKMVLDTSLLNIQHYKARKVE